MLLSLLKDLNIPIDIACFKDCSLCLGQMTWNLKVGICVRINHISEKDIVTLQKLIEQGYIKLYRREW